MGVAATQGFYSTSADLLTAGIWDIMLIQPCLAIGIRSTLCDMQYHDKDDAQAAHGASGIRLPMVHVLSPIPKISALLPG
jgi:hypothetical protein